MEKLTAEIHSSNRSIHVMDASVGMACVPPAEIFPPPGRRNCMLMPGPTSRKANITRSSPATTPAYQPFNVHCRYRTRHLEIANSDRCAEVDWRVSRPIIAQPEILAIYNT
ncbi:hypothetical protein [Mesorhizobium sp. 43Arga]